MTAPRSKRKPDYQTAETLEMDPEGMIADYLAGRAVMVRRSVNPVGFTVQSVLIGGGTEFDICDADALVGMVRFKLSKTDERLTEGTVEGTEEGKIETRNDVSVTPIGIEAKRFRTETDRLPNESYAASDFHLDAFVAAEGVQNVTWGWIAIEPEEPEGPAPDSILVDGKRYNVVGIETRDGRRGYRLHRQAEGA